MVELARMLAGALADAEVLGATAPDELAILFPAENADRAGKELTTVLGDEPLDVELPAGRTVTVQYAAGVAGSPEHATTGDELYMAADAALAEAVETGRPLATAR
jgi:GGDEF domain-containing protein